MQPSRVSKYAVPTPFALGAIGTLMMSVCSFGAGAVRNRGGVLRAIHLDFLAYGHAQGIVNVVFFAGLLAFIAAWIVLMRDVARGRPALLDVRRTLAAWVAPMILAAPMFSRDVYSYLMQGAMLRDGFDPYSQGAAVNPGPMLLEVSHDWRNTTTPYGPLHLWLAEGITRLVGDNITAGVLAFKLVSIAGFATIAWTIPRIAERLGADPVLALALGVANPVMVLHMVGGMHNEAIMVALVSAGLLGALRGGAGFLGATVCLGVAISLKATAAIALPFIVWMLARRLTPRRPLVGLFAAGPLLVAGAAGVVAAVTWASGTSWGWVAEISGNSKVVNPLSAPSLLAQPVASFLTLFDSSITYNSVLEALRTGCTILMLLGLVIVWGLSWRDDVSAIRGTAAAYLVAFALNSVTLPWYYASLITLVPTTRLPRGVLMWATGLSVAVALAFTGSGNHKLFNPIWMLAAAAAAWAATEWAFRPSARSHPPKTPSPAPAA